MKAVINEKETPVQERKFPWIGIGQKSNIIVVFWSPNKATCLCNSGDFVIGEDYSNYIDLHISTFTPFTGTITLSND